MAAVLHDVVSLAEIARGGGLKNIHIFCDCQCSWSVARIWPISGWELFRCALKNIYFLVR